MMYNARTNREIHPAVMPAGWKDNGECGMFTVYPESKALSCFKARVRMYDNKVNQKEIICFLLSNYIAYEKGLKADPTAMNVLKYGKKYFPKYREPGIHHTIGSIPRPFYSMVRNSLPQLSIKKASHLVYYTMTAFYNAPDRITDRMCERIESLKHPNKSKISGKYVILQSLVPDNILKNIRSYAHNAGMTVNELMCVVLQEVCMSKKERKENCHPLNRIFNLYRIMRQEKGVFTGNKLSCLYILVGDEHDKRYLSKFLSRRGLSKSEILRKAVRALEYVIGNRDKLSRKVQYVPDEPEEESDEVDYMYSRMERMDFYRSIYR